MLNFLGIGSCFNVQMGNTSAYYKKGKKLILFDCGESVFERIIEKNLLDGISSIDIYITHSHSDHIGSLPSLIFYLTMILKIKPTIYFPTDTLKSFLNLSGVSTDLYNHVKIRNIPHQVYFVYQDHSKYIPAFGYILYLDGKYVYYGGDAETFNLKNLELAPNKNGMYWEDKDIVISNFYIEVTKYQLNAHMNVHELAKIFPQSTRKFVTTMHFDDEEVMELAKNLGFKVAAIT